MFMDVLDYIRREVSFLILCVCSWGMLSGFYACSDDVQEETPLQVSKTNIFFGPAINAAKAVASQVESAVNNFTTNFYTAVRPQIIKSYAAKDYGYFIKLLFFSSRYSFYLMLILCIPIQFQIDTILEIWLKEPPPGVVLFTRLALLESLINSVSLPLTTAARAPGKMKMYELTLGIIQILIFPASWLILLYGGEAYTVFVVAIIANLLMFIVRLILVHQLILLPIRKFIYTVVIPVFLIILFSTVLVSLLKSTLPSGLISCCVVGMATIFFSVLGMFFIGFNKEERQRVTDIIMQKFCPRGTA